MGPRYFPHPIPSHPKVQLLEKRGNLGCGPAPNEPARPPLPKLVEYYTAYDQVVSLWRLALFTCKIHTHAKTHAHTHTANARAGAYIQHTITKYSYNVQLQCTLGHVWPHRVLLTTYCTFKYRDDIYRNMALKDSLILLHK